jgi:hypothetical protein
MSFLDNLGGWFKNQLGIDQPAPTPPQPLPQPQNPPQLQVQSQALPQISQAKTQALPNLSVQNNGTPNAVPQQQPQQPQNNPWTFGRVLNDVVSPLTSFGKSALNTAELPYKAGELAANEIVHGPNSDQVGQNAANLQNTYNNSIIPGFVHPAEQLANTLSATPLNPGLRPQDVVEMYARNAEKQGNPDLANSIRQQGYSTILGNAGLNQNDSPTTIGRKFVGNVAQNALNVGMVGGAGEGVATAEQGIKPLLAKGGESILKYGIPGGVAQTLSEDNPNLKSLAGNVVSNSLIAGALPIATGALELGAHTITNPENIQALKDRAVAADQSLFTPRTTRMDVQTSDMLKAYSDYLVGADPNIKGKIASDLIGNVQQIGDQYGVDLRNASTADKLATIEKLLNNKSEIGSVSPFGWMNDGQASETPPARIPQEKLPVESNTPPPAPVDNANGISGVGNGSIKIASDPSVSPRGLIIGESRPQPDGSVIRVKALTDPETGRFAKDESGKPITIQERVDKNTGQPINLNKEAFGPEDRANLDKLNSSASERQGPIKVLKEADPVSQPHITDTEIAAARDAGVHDVQRNIENFPAAGKGNMEDLNAREAGKIVRNAKNTAQGELTNLYQRANIVDQAIKQGVKTAEEHKMFQDAVEHPESIPDYLNRVKKPDKFLSAIEEQKALTNYVNEHQVGMGREVAKRENYYPHVPDLSRPEDLAKYKEIEATKRGDPNSPTYAKQRVFNDIREMESNGFHQKFDNANDALHDYVARVGKSVAADSYINSIKEAAPGHITSVEHVKEGQLPIDNQNRSFSTSRVGGLDTTLLSPSITKAMSKFVEHQDIHPVIKYGLDTPAQIAKQSVFLGGLFHNLKESWKYGSQELTSILGDAARTRELAPNVIKSEQAFWSSRAFSNIMKDYRDSGHLEAATHDGLTLGKSGDVGKINQDIELKPVEKARNGAILVKDTAKGAIDTVFHDPLFQRKIPTMKMETYAAEMRRYDIPLDVTQRTPAQNLEAGKIARQINSDYGGVTTGAIGKTPYGKLLSRIATISPDFTGGKLNTVGRAFTGGGAGSLARRQIIGELATAAIVSVAGNVVVNKATGNKESAKQLALDALQGKFTSPYKNDKGERLKINVPKSVVGDIQQLASNPLKFVTSHGSPITRAIPELITGKDRYDNSLTPNKLNPSFFDKLIAIAKQSSPVPVTQVGNQLAGRQNLATTALNIGGFKVDKDQTDPQAVATTKYFQQQKDLTGLLKSGNLSQIDPSLQNVSPAEGTKMYNSGYMGLHPAATKDENGNNVPSEWNALSSAKKASYYLANDQSTGAQSLSPNFFIDKKLSQNDPSRPHDPLFDLQGTGTGFVLDANKNVVGSSDIPKAQVALDYTSRSATDDQKALMLAANPWLSDYEKQVGQNSANYQQNMTQYLSGQGWNQNAVDQYFQQHPNNPAPIKPPSLSPETQSLMDQYGNITDPTEKAKFFQDNARELSGAFAADAVYKNQKGVAGGGLPLQDRPVPTPEQAALLAQLQKNPNHDKTISATNAKLIQANPTLSQFLADSGLNTTARDLAKYQFRDPSQPNLNAGQLINLGRPIDQSTLKGVSNLASYDIGKNAAGKYSFMQNGGFEAGTKPGGSGGGSKSHRVPKPRKIYNKPIHLGGGHKAVRIAKYKSPAKSSIKLGSKKAINLV